MITLDFRCGNPPLCSDIIPFSDYVYAAGYSKPNYPVPAIPLEVEWYPGPMVIILHTIPCTDQEIEFGQWWEECWGYPAVSETDNTTWQDMFPTGRDIFYEGDNPKGFVSEMKAKFNFDPSKSPPNDFWSGLNWSKRNGYCFHCPANLLDQIYEQYPCGS